VGGQLLALSGEACPGVVGNGDSYWAGVSRRHSTGGGSAVRREGPNANRMTTTSVLASATKTAANPHKWAWWGTTR
ncbi:MAG TPA: hypothetical protein VKP64_10715, partial [Mycobacteriales bacterium]|nr:hypothetical protein [Mycobacteriales bacterium]